MSLRTWFNPSTATTSAPATPSPRGARRARAAASSRLWRSLRDGLSAAAGAAAAHRHGHFAEPLEPRTMLTQLVGGDDFYFVQRRNEEELVHRIKLSGNIEVELVGSEVDEDNNILLRNLNGAIYRGRVFQQPTGDGLVPLGGSLAMGGVSIPLIANSTINAIAADNDGDVYAFNVITLEDTGGGGGGGGQMDTAQIQLLQLNIPAGGFGVVTSTVIEDDLGAALNLTDVTGADFNPVTGELFFAASVEDQGGGGGGGQQGSLLISMDVDAANPGGTLGVFGTFVEARPGAAPQAVTVSTLTFKPDGTMAGISETGIFVTGAGNTFLRPPPSPNPNLNAINVLSGTAGGSTGEIQALEFNPYTGDFLGVGSGDPNAEVLNICDNGRALAYGPVGVGNLTNMTFVPGLTDPFTGNTDGAFVGIDPAADTMYYIDPHNRRPRQSIWNVFITRSDASGMISMGFVNPLETIIADPNRLFDDMKPFDGSVGPLNVFNLNAPPQPIPVDAPGTGRVLLGALTEPSCDPGDIVGVPFDAPVGLPQPGPGEPIPFPLLPTSISAVSPGVSMNPGQTLGKFLLGGTLFGQVNAGGSIDEFYCGWLLTGRSGGQTSLAIAAPENFRVDGDLRSLYSKAPIGTDAVSATKRDAPDYVTGFDLQVNGTLGHVSTLDSIYGSIEAENRPEDDESVGFPDNYQQSEMETKGPAAFDNFIFSGEPGFYNDTFDTAEYRGSIRAFGQEDMIRAGGTLQATTTLQDYADYYAVGVMAGQTVGVQVLTGGNFGGAAGGGSVLAVGVFDPDNRLIASDYSGRSISLNGQYFEFTADRPGAYRIAVAQLGNGTFLQANPAGLLAVIPYELRVTKTGDIGIGGITAVANIFDLFSPGGGPDHAPGEDPGFSLRNGDFGCIRAGNEFFSISGQTVNVESGDLRSVDGASLGFGTGSTPPDANGNGGTAASLSDPLTVDVPQGSVGLLRSRTGILAILTATGTGAIGGDFQMIDAASSMGADVSANGGYGVIRCADMAVNPADLFVANADDFGNDGFFDLIDVAGNMGTLTSGGPGFSTGAGGNVRYIRVGGDAFVDQFFGGGGNAGIETFHSPGEVVQLKDDSGSSITFTPSDAIFNPAFDPVNNPGVPQFLADAASFTIRSYPIRGSGGVAVIDVTSDNSLTIEGTGPFEGATAEIGAVVVSGQGAAVLHSNTQRVVPLHLRNRAGGGDLVDFTNPFDPINPGSGGNLGQPDYQDAPNPMIVAPGPVDTDGDGVPDQNVNQPIQRDLILHIGGPSRVDIFDIIGGYDRNFAVAQPTGFEGQFTRIENTTGGEIVNITATSIGELISNGNIGITEGRISKMALNPIRVINAPNTGAPTGSAGGVSPFLNQRTGIVVNGNAAQPGNVIAIRSTKAIGNVIVGGSIGQIVADSDHNHDLNDDVFEGIAGPIWADGRPDPALASNDPGGDLYNIDIGEGIAPGGTGAFSRSGLFANRRIDTVRGTNAYIRGDIFAGDAAFPETFESQVRPGVGQGGNNGGNGGNGGGGGGTPTTTPPTIGSGAGGREAITDSIGRVLLNGGSIINADIIVGSTPNFVLSIPVVGFQQEAADTIDNPFYEIGRIAVSGGGGIIGSSISAADIGSVIVHNGFGVFTTDLTSLTDGRFRGVDADGYGIRGLQRDGGSSQNYVIARGDGSSVSTARFDQQVRLSEQFEIDPFFGTLPNPLIDLHSVLGTSAATPEIPGRTDTGIIEDSGFRSQRDLDKVSAYEIRASNQLLGPSELNFGNSINQIHVRHEINGLGITTGRLGVFRPAGDVFNLNMTVAGPIRNMLISGDLAGNSQIATNGRVGNINFLRVNGRLDGIVRANGKIGRLFVGEAMTGKIASTRTRGRGNALDNLTIGGELGEGGLEIDGNVGKITVARDLGRTGENLFIRGSIKSLIVSGNLFSNVNVRDKLGSLKVGGSIMSGATIEAQQIGSIMTGGDFQQGATIRAKKIGRQRFGGQLLGTIDLV